jgi:hypothetical protein
MQLYVERFNRLDWDGLRELISAGTQLRVANAFSGAMGNACLPAIVAQSEIVAGKLGRCRGPVLT